MAGEPALLRRWQRVELARLVHRAESRTGLQIVLYVGPTEASPQQHAERLLKESGADGVPGALVLIAPEERRVEIRTSPMSRISDEAAAQAVGALTQALAGGHLTGGVRAALNVLAAAAGPLPAGSVRAQGLPNVLSGEGPENVR